MRIPTKRYRGRIVAAEFGTCRRCEQQIRPGERIVNEAGKYPSHRDCVRLHVTKTPPWNPPTSFGKTCGHCAELIEGAHYHRNGVPYHAECET